MTHRLMRCGFSACLLLAVCSGAGCADRSASPAVGDGEEIVPEGFASLVPVLAPREVEAGMYRLHSPPRLVALTERLRKGMAAHPEVLRESLKDPDFSGPLPYDERLGLTREEYGEFLALADDVTLKKELSIPLVLASDGPQRYRLDSPGLLEDILPIVVDLDNGIVETPLGKTSVGVPSAPDARLTTLGPWQGFEWALQRPQDDERLRRWMAGGTPPDDVCSVHVDLGRLDADGRCVLYYRGKHLVHGALARNFRLVLVFPPQADP